MDPIHEGPDPTALKYFATYPQPNSSAGDAPNFAGYTFASPITSHDNWFIARLDYTMDPSDTLFLRGEAVHDRDVTAGPFLPGHPPQVQAVDFSKGLVAGYTKVFGPTVVNNFRYGITKQSLGDDGDSDQPWVYMRDLSQDAGNYTSAATAPVDNFIDTVSWQHGSHNFQFGANIALIRRNDYSNGNSFSDALTNADWVSGGGFAGKGNALDPAANGYPAVGTDHSYDFPLAAMMGMASEIDAHYTYKITSRAAATPLSQGANVARRWATDTYSLFFQDTWQIRHDLSLVYGLDYQLMTPITEMNGQQVTPSVNMGQWFNKRASDMLKGIPSNQDALISFVPSGWFWGGPGLYGVQSKNIAPRLGFAWSPRPGGGLAKSLAGDGQTSIRGGFGMYYDNFGPALAMSYDAEGSFGLSTVLENPTDIAIDEVPRITNMNVIPTTDNSGATIYEPPPPSTYPITYPAGSEAISYGIDQSLKTPYSYAVDFSIQRQLPGNMTLDTAYVGHYGHGELALEDIAEPLNLVDPATGITYFQAATALAKLARAGTPLSAINASTVGPTAPYWSDMFAPQAQYNICSTGANTTSILQAAYDLFEGPGCGSEYNETTGLYITDVAGYPFVPKGGLNSYYNSQFSSLWAWRGVSNSNYNALQVTLHKQMSNGVLLSLNYTYSHSLDIGSFAERSAHFLTDSIINSWDPHQMYASSDFDLRHQINGYWLAKLPFGRGEAIGGNANRVADGLIGGWQLGGTTRWSSGFPFSAFMGYVWPTNWDEMGWANQIHAAPTEGASRYSLYQPAGSGLPPAPNVFRNPTAALGDFDYAYPGQSGQRNNIRGQGFFDTDMNLSKKFNIVEKQTFEIRWQVFNAFNNTRFDVQSINDEQDAGAFGNYTGELSTPREMEFAGVYTF